MNAAEPVRYGRSSPAAPAFGYVRITTSTLTNVVERLRKGIEDAGLWVLHEIDPQEILSRAGHRIGAARQILFFHPDLMVRLLEADPAALLEAPLKFAVMELPEGQVSTRWIDPTASFSRYENPGLVELGKDLAAIFARIERTALSATSPAA